MSFYIIEDCSPYFIRYRHDGDEEIFKLSRDYKNKLEKQYGKHMHTIPYHVRMPIELGTEVLSHVYGSDKLNFQKERVSLFITKPHEYYRPHRDGLNLNWGINYTVDIRDELCAISWYDSECFEGRNIDNLNGRSREIADFNVSELNQIIPAKTFTAKNNEVILFNTDIYHDVNNIKSNEFRTILTLRTLSFDTTFDQVKNILFGL